MATQTTTPSRTTDSLDYRNDGHRRPAAETKASFKTTEFFAYLAVLAGILIAGLVVDDAGAGGFGAQKVWLYATILTVGYMVSRGLAKSGSRDPYTHDHGDH
jgi:predicted lipid-binding transport protein (Tim44 family)